MVRNIGWYGHSYGKEHRMVIVMVRNIGWS